MPKTLGVELRLLSVVDDNYRFVAAQHLTNSPIEKVFENRSQLGASHFRFFWASSSSDSNTDKTVEPT